MKISRSAYGYQSRARDATPLIMRIKEITATRVHYGYRRVHVLLRREREAELIHSGVAPLNVIARQSRS